ncbi:Caldesmon, partial [Ophiophagus hannah]
REEGEREKERKREKGGGRERKRGEREKEGEGGKEREREMGGGERKMGRERERWGREGEREKEREGGKEREKEEERDRGREKERKRERWREGGREREGERGEREKERERERDGGERDKRGEREKEEQEREREKQRKERKKEGGEREKEREEGERKRERENTITFPSCELHIKGNALPDDILPAGYRLGKYMSSGGVLNSFCMRRRATHAAWQGKRPVVPRAASVSKQIFPWRKLGGGGVGGIFVSDSPPFILDEYGKGLKGLGASKSVCGKNRVAAVGQRMGIAWGLFLGALLKLWVPPKINLEPHFKSFPFQVHRCDSFQLAALQQLPPENGRSEGEAQDCPTLILFGVSGESK